MCIHHYYHHLPCGHMIKNMPLSIQHHCLDVEKALRYYHDQPSYHLLDQQLCNKYGVPATDQLETPSACPEVFPPPFSSLEDQKRWQTFYWSWVYETLESPYALDVLHGRNPALTFQKDLDRSSEEQRYMAALTHYSATQESVPTHGPYPVHQMEHIMDIRARQHNPSTQPHFNVIQHTVNWGCGRTNSLDCLVGHNAPQGPLCPFLLACRLPRDHVTPEAQFLGAVGSRSRGGANNNPSRNKGGRHHFRSAPGYMGEGGSMCAVPLPDSFIDAIMRVGQIAPSGPSPLTTPMHPFQHRPSRNVAPLPPPPIMQALNPSQVAPAAHRPQLWQAPADNISSPDRWLLVWTGQMPPAGIPANRDPIPSQQPAQFSPHDGVGQAGQTSNSNVAPYRALLP